MSGWTLTIPAGWGMPFWQSLVFSETRVGGLRERSQQVFEAGAPRFPEDFPCTLAFDEYETRRADEDKSYFDRRPSAKRPNFDKLGVSDPFKSNFAGLVEQLAGSLVEKLAGSARDLTPWFVNTDVAEALALHLAGKPARKLARNPESLANILFHHYPRPTGGVFSILSALVRVTVVPCGRGAPEELGIIYKVDDQIWNSLREFVNDSHGGKEEDGGKTFEMVSFFFVFSRRRVEIEILLSFMAGWSVRSDRANYDGIVLFETRKGARCWFRFVERIPRHGATRSTVRSLVLFPLFFSHIDARLAF